MKRLLSISVMLLLAVLTINAQIFEFSYHGESLADGATVIISAVEDDWGFGEMCCYTNPSNNPNNGLILKTLSGSQTNGSATVTIEENSMNPSRLLWCIKI